MQLGTTIPRQILKVGRELIAYLPFLSFFISIAASANQAEDKTKKSLEFDSTRIVNELTNASGNLPAIDSLGKALLLFSRESKNTYILEDTYWYNLSKAYFVSGELETAYACADSGMHFNLKYGTKYRSAKFHNIKASVLSYKQKYQQAIEEFKTALKLLEDNNDFHTAALIKNNIANIFFGLSDYDSAFEYSQASYAQLKSENDTVNLPGVTGIAAISAFKLKKNDLGKLLSAEALALSKRYSNPVGLIIANHSYGELYSSETKYDSAIVYFNNSLNLSEQFRQANYIMLNKIGLQHSFLKLIQYDSSIKYGLQALEESKLLGNKNTLYSINKNLGYAYAGKKEYSKAYNHMQLAHEYYISSAGTENQKAIHEILIKYDSEKKEKELSRNKIEIIEKENTLIRRNQWIILLSSLVLILILSYFLYNRIQNQKLLQLKRDQEAELLESAIQAEEIERERIANELHDGMASVITGIKIRLEEEAKKGNKENLMPMVEQLSLLHEETRRMSHNLMPLNIRSINLVERLSNYSKENSHSKFKIYFNNNLELIPNIEVNKASILFRITQELIHNAQKHSHSNSCHVQLSSINKEIYISVEDEGVGFDKITKEGMGLSSIRRRLKLLEGEIEIESRLNQGALITISIKL